MARHELSLPVMALGGLAVFAIATTVLYVGVSARRGESPAQVVPSTADDTNAASHPEAKPEAGNAQEWLALATARRHNRDYAGARDAYSRVIELNAMTADSWADYADALASMSGGSLAGEAERAIQRALSLDPNHPKALWLEATHAYEEHRYADALILWKRLRAVLRDDSPDAKIVDANIAESAQLAGTPKG